MNNRVLGLEPIPERYRPTEVSVVLTDRCQVALKKTK